MRFQRNIILPKIIKELSFAFFLIAEQNRTAKIVFQESLHNVLSCFLYQLSTYSQSFTR